ncbi:hypothetical protein A3D11_00080 [Candidatus Peribacteria bacterium RIFCSPHIGHO2_02_FULL_49_16]|nr:MAG: hypothetical protein A2880_02195 [Candidatus Peribacteria bacterium RIFCSPHIGHO2_01_FULL_49_38]OGJ59998.1 MAG: hypothetical protein A3D11_00080 [Candidatus Peribacteria bacterium RIFCSPHIGHO2_02_FULL_49_16]
MSNQKIVHSTLWQIASQCVMAFLSIITVKFVALGLSKELAGNYNSAYGFLQLFGILADFGLYAVSVREMSAAKDKEKILSTIILLRSVTIFLALGSALLFAWILPVWQGTPLPLSITIAALVPFFTLLAGMMRTVFQITYTMHYVFVAEVVQRIITVALIGLLVILGMRGSTDLHHLHLVLFFGGIGAFVLFVISLFYANRLLPIQFSFDAALLKEIFKKAAPYGLAFLCIALYRQFDTTLIALLRDDYELQNAYYGFAIRITDMAYLIPTFLLNSTLPMLTRSHIHSPERRNILERTLLLILTFGIIICLFSLLWPRPFMQLLTTEQYLSTATRTGADTALALLSLPMLLNGLILFCFYALLTIHHWRPLVTRLAAIAFLTILLNSVLIPRFGFIGAGITSIIIHVLLTLILLPVTLSAIQFSIPWKKLLPLIPFTVLLGGALLLTQPLLTSNLHTVIGLGSMGLWTGILVHTLKIQRLTRYYFKTFPYRPEKF